MKYRSNCFVRDGGKEKYYCVEYNDTDIDDDSEWFELEDFTKQMCEEFVEVLNKNHAAPPYYKYKKS